MKELKLRKIYPLPLGEGRVRVTGLRKSCNPHPARQLLLSCRASLSQRERDAPPSRSQINYAPLAVSIRSAAAFPLRMESSIEK